MLFRYAKNSHMKIYCHGASVLEVLVIVATCAALLRLGIPNWYEFRSRASDIQSVKFYRQLKDELLKRNQEQLQAPIAIFNQTNTNKLGNLINFSIPEDIKLHYAVFLPQSTSLEADQSLIAFEVSHDLGNTIFRYIRIGDELLEQQISKEPL